MSKEDYDRYLTDFGERLEAAAPPPARGRRGWVVGAVIGAAAIVALALLLAAPGGNEKINVMAEARAALPASGELVHFVAVSTNSLVGADDAAQERFEDYTRRFPHAYGPHRYEQWSAENRWRVADPTNQVYPAMFGGSYDPDFFISDRELQRIGLTDEVIGPTQDAYANGIDSLYVERLGVIIRADLGEAGWDGDLIGSFPGGVYTGAPTGFVGSDPVTMLRKRLESGNLRDAGTAEVDGRTVRRLVGQGFEYDVDAETFEPVRMRQFTNWVGGGPQYPSEKMADDLNFEDFETLPLNSETEGLLKIDAPPTTTVIDAQVPDDR
jgi:hypothetical protein